MKLPWKRSLKNKVEEMEEEIEELREDKQKAVERFQAEKERRSKLSTEKQEAERKINRLEDRIEGLKSDKEDEEEKISHKDIQEISLEEARRGLELLSSVKVNSELFTVYSPESVTEIEGFRELKNSLNADTMEILQKEQGFVAFTDENFLEIVLKTRPFHEGRWMREKEFQAEEILDFISSEKTWIWVSAGRTKIVKEASGEIIDVEEIENRVDRKHSKGGFSQGRFERKRDRQISEHLDQVREHLDDENVFLVGEKSLCSQLEGDYMGGMDSNRDLVDALYGFRLVG